MAWLLKLRCSIEAQSLHTYQVFKWQQIKYTPVMPQHDVLFAHDHDDVLFAHHNHNAPAMDLVGKELRGSLTQAKAAIASLGGSKALPNQDRASMIRLANGAEMLAVFDGHGQQCHAIRTPIAPHDP
eukprot:452504-Amphidinium_carterae.2